eukprot:292866-Chlamydomonas_euryale.AAC.1
MPDVVTSVTAIMEAADRLQDHCAGVTMRNNQDGTRMRNSRDKDKEQPIRAEGASQKGSM